MSDEARDLLVYGVAAAQAHSPDEARNYLEWVLRTDADPDQQADAWYWLSYITDDPEAKRGFLENVLALDPRYPEALRDMAILEGRLKPADMHDPRFAVPPVSPSPNLATSETQSYKCPRCGARMTAQGASASLHCGFCGYTPGLDAPTSVPGGLTEQDWVAAIYARQGHKWELPTERSFKCASCGASVLLPPSAITASCPFCGIPYVTHTAEERELIEPNGVVPFKLSPAEAVTHIAAWLQAQKLRSGDNASPTPLSAIYVPFWTFDIDGEVSWHGWQTSTQNRKFVRVPASGSVPLYYDDMLVPASGSLPAELLERLKYDFTRSVPYSPDALAGWPAEIYSISLADASITARDLAHRSGATQALISTNVSLAGDVEDLQVETPRESVSSYKLLMLPVFAGSYTYRDKTYKVVVNGQSGQVQGEAPQGNLMGFLDALLG